MPEVDVISIADVNLELAKRTARRFKIAKFFSNYQELLRDDTVEMIDLCTPPMIRLEIIQLAAKLGKHILVEKPLALSAKEAMEICRVVKESNVKLCVVQNFRYFPSVSKVVRRIRSGYLGSLVSINGLFSGAFPCESTRSTWYYAPQGVLFDQGPHLIDMITWINDSRVRRVFAMGGDFADGKMGFLNHLQILLEFENETFACADTSWLTGIFRFKLDIMGTGGHIYLDVRNDNYLEVHGMLTPLDETKGFFNKLRKTVKGVSTESLFVGAALYYRDIVKGFLSSIERNTQPPVTAEHALMVTTVLDAAFKSVRESRPIYLDEFVKEQF